LAQLRARVPEAPYAAAGVRPGSAAASATSDERWRPELEPIARGPRARRALVRQFDAMRLHHGAGRSSSHDVVESRSRPSDSASSSRQHQRGTNDDDFLVLADSALNGTPNFWSGGARRVERLQVLSEWAALSTIPADANALAAGAQELRKQTERLHPITFATDFSDALRAFHPHEQLPKTIFECEDAALAWQTAADQYHAAIDLAGKVGVSAADIAKLDEEAAHCDAQATRLVIKASLLTGMIHFRRNQHGLVTGHPRAIEAVLKPLRIALERCDADALRALPLDAAPIEAFDDELRALADALGQGSAALAQNVGTAFAERAKNALSELEYVVSALSLVLRGEPNVPALLATLRSALAAPTAEADGLLVAAQARSSDPSRSLDSLTDTFESWYQTARAYDEAIRTFEHTTTSWPEAAQSAPEARQTFASLGESRHTAVRRMNEALAELFSALSAGMDEPHEVHEPHDENTDRPAASMAVSAAEILIGSDLLWRCQALRAKLDASPFPRDAADIDAVRLSAPFAALEQYAQALLEREADLLDAANRVRQAALAADKAAPAYGRALGPALRQFASSCARQRKALVDAAFRKAHADTVAFTVQESNAMGPALKCLYDLRQSLPLVQFGASVEDDAAAREEQTANEALISNMREAVQRIEAHLAQMPAPPADALELIHDNHANLQLNLNALSAVLRSIAESVECCGEASRAIREGGTADCTAQLRLLADRMRRAGERASGLSAAARNKRLTRGTAGERAERTLRFTRRVARTAKSIQYTLTVLADLSRGYQKTADLSREPTLDPLRFHQLAEQLSDEVARAAKDIDATRNQLIEDVGTRHPSEDAAAIAVHDTEQIHAFTSRLEWRYIADFDSGKRQWLRATVRALAARLDAPAGTVPFGAEQLLGMIDEHLASGTKILMIASSRVEGSEKDRMANAFRENNDIRQEVQACRERLKQLRALAPTAPTRSPAPPARPASTSAGSARNDSRGKKASGKAKRR
jgi:hypothetical protein